MNWETKLLKQIRIPVYESLFNCLLYKNYDIYMIICKNMDDRIYNYKKAIYTYIIRIIQNLHLLFSTHINIEITDNNYDEIIVFFYYYLINYEKNNYLYSFYNNTLYNIDILNENDNNLYILSALLSQNQYEYLLYVYTIKFGYNLYDFFDYIDNVDEFFVLCLNIKEIKLFEINIENIEYKVYKRFQYIPININKVYKKQKQINVNFKTSNIIEMYNNALETNIYTDIEKIKYKDIEIINFFDKYLLKINSMILLKQFNDAMTIKKYFNLNIYSFTYHIENYNNIYIIYENNFEEYFDIDMDYILLLIYKAILQSKYKIICKINSEYYSVYDFLFSEDFNEYFFNEHKFEKKIIKFVRTNKKYIIKTIRTKWKNLKNIELNISKNIMLKILKNINTIIEVIKNI